MRRSLRNQGGRETTCVSDPGVLLRRVNQFLLKSFSLDVAYEIKLLGVCLKLPAD